MNRYLLSVHSAEGPPGDPMTPEQMQEMMGAIGALEAEMQSVGALLFSGRLSEPRDATVVRGGNGKAMTSDGPFVEAKEHIGGFYIIQAVDSAAAIEWATKTSAAIGQPIEVRPFVDSAGG